MEKSKNDPRSLTHKQKWRFSKLKDITENFSEKRLIAGDGVGAVYKVFTKDGKLMAVKKFNEYSEEQFKSELDFNHENIVQPTGYCEKTVSGVVEERILCYELLPERSLDKILYAESDLLDWPKRYIIIKGICQGLNYLHKNYEADAIVHMDIKPGNIVLDGMVPKLGSFSQSRRIPTEDARTFCESRASRLPHRMNKTNSDIYNLGILIMEIVTGERRPSSDNEESTRSYIDKVQKDRHHVASNYRGFMDQVENCIDIAMDCVESNAPNGLTADKVISRLETECSSKAENDREHNTRARKRSAEEMLEEPTKAGQLESRLRVQKPLFPRTPKTEGTKLGKDANRERTGNPKTEGTKPRKDAKRQRTGNPEKISHSIGDDSIGDVLENGW